MSKVAGENSPRAAGRGVWASAAYKVGAGLRPQGPRGTAAASPIGTPLALPRHRPEVSSICEGSVTGNHLLASQRQGAYSSFSQLFRNIQFYDKRITYCGVEQSGSSPGS